MDFSALKAAIQAAIRQNGNNEITGNIMQGILLSMVNTMGDASIIPLVDTVAALSTRIANEYIQLGVSNTVNINNIGSGVLSFTSASVPSGLPSIDYSDGAVIFTIRQNETDLSNFDRQFLITKNAIYTRVYFNGWQIWKGNDITKEVIQLGLKTEAFATDNLKGGIYSFTAPTGASLGFPDLDYGDGGQLSVFRQNDDSLSDWDKQMLTSNMKPNFVYTRTYYNNAWGIWKLYKSPTPREVIGLGVKTSAFSIDNLVSGIYDFTAPAGANLGFPDLDYGDGGQLSVFRQNDDSLSNFDRQMLVSNMKPNFVYTRVYYDNAWGIWKSYSYEPDRTIECGPGKQYTTLRAAVNAAIQEKGTTVIVYPGTYDLTQEFATELANHSGSGILLVNDVHLKFLAGAYVTCLVDVSNTWAYENFEPFRVSSENENTNFTIEGINIKCKNTRYCVHDEYFGANVKYIHKYINCHMEQTDENQLAHYHQCIGIGLGQNGTIIVDGGFYKSSSLYYDSHYTSADDMQQPITAHNGNNANCDSRIFIKDVYLADKGYLRFGNYGSSTILTPVEVCGCRMYKPVMLMNETFDSQQVTNFEIIAFNNEIITQ